MKKIIYNGSTPTEEDIFDAIEKDKNMARHLTAEYLLARYNFATMLDNREVYIYENGIYVNNGERKIHQEMVQLWREHYTDYHRNIIESMIEARTYCNRDEFDSDIKRLCVRNGIINLQTNELEDFSPERKFLTRLPVTYNPEAKCPRIEKFLSEVLKPEDILPVKEMLGYCLHKDYPKSKVFLFLGEGRNGKSVFANVIKSLLGEENVSALSLHQIINDKFARHLLYGKLANICPEISDKTIESFELVKALTGGDLIEVDVKFKKHFKFRNKAKLIFAANKLPVIKDDTYAFQVRWMIIEFPNRFEGANENKNLINELTTEDELSGLLNIAIHALKRLRQNNWEFSLSDNTLELGLQYHRLADNVRSFADDCLTVDFLAKTSVKELYQAYTTYCKRANQRPIYINQFSSRLRELKPEITPCKKGYDNAFAGIGIIEKAVGVSEDELLESLGKKLAEKDKKEPTMEDSKDAW